MDCNARIWELYSLNYYLENNLNVTLRATFLDKVFLLYKVVLSLFYKIVYICYKIKIKQNYKMKYFVIPDRRIKENKVQLK